MAIVLGIISVLLIIFGGIVGQIFGFIILLVGALLHMRTRRNEQLDAMRGEPSNKSK